MSKGFLWFCQNNDKTDYVALSRELARTIKRYNPDSKICVVTDAASRFDSPYVDEIRVLKRDDSQGHSQKFGNEYKAFALSPFTHTIKLEADMMWTANTGWWWHYLCQHDLVFAVDCLDYREQPVKDTAYRKLFYNNHLPNIYNGLMYFRKSERAKRFFDLAGDIARNWDTEGARLLKNCFDPYPTTDVVYALAYRIMDPTQQELIDYPWFKFIHNKPAIHSETYHADCENYYYPLRINDAIYYGGQRLSQPLHYYNKKFLEILDGRVF